MSRDFYLVQRCKQRGWEDPSYGFDGIFNLDYMGSSEYEWGAVSDSLKRLRAHDDLVRKARDITIDGVTRRVWFVGSMASLKATVDAFEAWVPTGRSLDGSQFVENFTGRDRFGGPVSDYMQDIVLWWALGEDVLFALDVETADLALRAVTTVRQEASK